MKLRTALALGLCLAALPAVAQVFESTTGRQIVVTAGASGGTSIPVQPTGATSTQAAGTITLGATFQTALASSATRLGCSLQNTSTHTLYVYVGTLGSATTANSFQVPPNGMFYCNTGQIVVTGAINVTTSTTSDTYVVASQ